MTTRKSAKAKGRKLEKETVADLLDAFAELTEEDVRVVPVSVAGEDLHLSSKARALLGSSFECKARAKIAVYDWFDQCKRNAGDHRPVLVMKADRKEKLAVVRWDDLLAMLEARAGR